LKIIWNDNDAHKSEYNFEWLEKRNFTNANRDSYLKKFYRLEKKLWSKNDFASSMKHFDFNSIINDDCELYNWLQALITYGIAIINNVPPTENEARAIADRVGFIRRTHYGEEFMVKAKDDTVNVAYLSKNLQMHTDLPYYEYAPGVNLLHCLVQSKSQGAQNLLCDGFYVAQLIKDKYPKEFQVLSTVLINWLDIGREETGPPFHSIYRAPMICLDYEHNVERINHSIPQRDSFFATDIETAQEWYKALSLFVKLTHSEAAEIKTDEGMC
jgi:gamma-butyrobetaine dioxygenase